MASTVAFNMELPISTIELFVSAAASAGIADGLADREAAIAWLLQRGGPLQTAAAVDAYLSLYANEDSIMELNGLDTVLKSGDDLSIVPAIAGG